MELRHAPARQPITGRMGRSAQRRGDVRADLPLYILLVLCALSVGARLAILWP